MLLIDEVDRADEEFEAFLLELLSDFQVSIPELGTIKARSIPRVVLTSNGTRELSDALRRRCLYHYVDFPDVDREARIILARLPGIDTALALQVARMVAAMRKEDLRKVPGVAETLDWAATLAGLEVHDLRQEPEAVHETLICLLKTHEDRAPHARGERPPPRQGGVRTSCPQPHRSNPAKPIGARAPPARRLRAHAARQRLQGRARRDARRARGPCLARGLRPSSLQPALRSLFCATHSDWERFDEIFDAYWRGRGMRRAAVTLRRSRARRRDSANAGGPSDALGAPDHVERRAGRRR